MAEEKLTDIDFIEHMIDNEGWPDALGWLVSSDFGNQELNQLIYDANDQYMILNGYRRQIESLVDELRNTDA